MVALGLCVAAFAPVQAQERFTEPFGGRGGNQFISRCPAGAVLTGVSALTGAYINGIAPICDGRQGPGSGGGGDKRSAECPAGSVVKSIYVTLLRSDNHLVKDLRIECVSRVTGLKTAGVNLSTPGRYTVPLSNFRGDNQYPSSTLSCGTRVIVGLQGRSGASIDALGLICGMGRAR